jgi:hypothetical protein
VFSLLLLLFPGHAAMHDVALAVGLVTLSTAEDLLSGRTKMRAAAISPVLVLLIPCVE